MKVTVIQNGALAGPVNVVEMTARNLLSVQQADEVITIIPSGERQLLRLLLRRQLIVGRGPLEFEAQFANICHILEIPVKE